jgi:bacterioferritin
VERSGGVLGAGRLGSLRGGGQRQTGTDRRETRAGRIRGTASLQDGVSDERADGWKASAAGRPGAARPTHFVDRSRAVANTLADGSITDALAVTDEQEDLLGDSKDIESNSQNQPDPWPDQPEGRVTMQGDKEIIVALNDILTSELTAINQYFIHYKMLENWGYLRLAQKKREESIEEMKHADKVIERILFLDGVPNLQRLSPVRVGDEPIEMHKLDLELEREAVERLNQAIALCLDKKEAGTRELLESLLEEEEDSVEWLEAQLYIVKDIGRERYLAEQTRS